ncbi:MAG: hypothetical protein R3D71_07120 [Rickettsiales bacterium]
MGTSLIPLVKSYDTSILGVDPAKLGKEIYEALPSWQRAAIELLQLDEQHARGNKISRNDISKIIHDKLGSVAKSHAVVGKMLSEYLPDDPITAEYNKLGHKLPNKELLDKVGGKLKKILHPDRFTLNPEMQKEINKISTEVSGAIEFLRKPENTRDYKAIIDSVKINPEIISKIENVFNKAKGQKNVSSAAGAVKGAVGRLKGNKALVALASVLGIGIAYGGYKAYKSKQEKDKHSVDGVEYKGVDEATVKVGQSEIDSSKGSSLGLTVGGALGAVSHNKEKHAAAISKLDKVFDGAENKKGLLESLKKMKSSELWASTGRGAKAVIIAIPLSIVGSIIGSLSGLSNGEKKYKEAKEQFDDLVKENKDLSRKVAAYEGISNIDKSNKSFVAAEEARRAGSEHKSADSVIAVG